MMRANLLFMFAAMVFLSLLFVCCGQPDEGEENEASDLPQEITNSIGMKLKLIPAGSFMMGAVPGDEDAGDDESPRHSVEITEPFYMGVYEVTQEQYEAVMGENPSHSEGTDKPVECVSWNDAREFCQKLSNMTGESYRLPTEAEWEYACRAGTETKYYWGDEIDGDYDWYIDNSGNKTHEVGRKSPNPWGIYDMSGNVCEWCEDMFDDDYYSHSPMQDPQGPSSGNGRVLRGGSWCYFASYLRSSFRSSVTPDDWFSFSGFRIVREAAAVEEAVEIEDEKEDKIQEKSAEIVKETDLPVEITNSVGMKFRLIPAGEFMMGANPGDDEAIDVEKPSHPVKITKPFYIGVYEVTQAQYEAVMGESLSYFEGIDKPVDSVSWNDAREFCSKLSEMTGESYRLPTEAEWEYAYRAGTETKYFWGDSDSETTVKRYAWYVNNAFEWYWTEPHAAEEGTQEVGRKLPNPWGLYDMSGNVWEWCEDWYEKDYYSNSPSQDPKGPSSGENRVLRGGSWENYARGLRSSGRVSGLPRVGFSNEGFRIVRDVK